MPGYLKKPGIFSSLFHVTRKQLRSAMSEAAKPAELADYPVVLTLPIRWGDQDAFGHVNNVVHIGWFESARIVYLEQSGLEHLMSNEGLGPILASITCHYKRQLSYPDTVHIGARVSRLGNSSMTMEHAVYSESQGVIVADGDSVVVVFDYEKQKPRRIPAHIREAVETLEGHSFDS